MKLKNIKDTLTISLLYDLLKILVLPVLGTMKLYILPLLKDRIQHGTALPPYMSEILDYVLYILTALLFFLLGKSYYSSNSKQNKKAIFIDNFGLYFKITKTPTSFIIDPICKYHFKPIKKYTNKDNSYYYESICCEKKYSNNLIENHIEAIKLRLNLYGIKDLKKQKLNIKKIIKPYNNK